MHRFFIPPNYLNGLQVTFPGDVSYQITHVLRLGNGDQVGVLDNSGLLYHVRLQGGAPGSSLTGEIIEKKAVSSEPDVHLTLYFGLTSREKVEWILQKGTEIGVSAFCPFISARTLVQSPELTPKRQARWVRIIREAAEQSGRGRLPALNPATSLLEALSEAARSFRLNLMAWEESANNSASLESALKGQSVDALSLFVGPEGGFSEEEVNQAVAAGFQVVSLGARILRMETAAIIFPALVLYQLGQLS
jgi:16S rRNA (uracil1498-N3)-methyltransferase